MRDQLIERNFFSFFSGGLKDLQNRSAQEIDDYIMDFLISLPAINGCTLREIQLEPSEFTLFRRALETQAPTIVDSYEEGINYRGIKFTSNPELGWNQHKLTYSL